MRFTISFDKQDIHTLHKFWDQILETQQWSEGYFTRAFEDKWSAYIDVPSVAFSSWSGAAMAALEFFQLRGQTVLCPSNTFMATPLSVLKAGGNVEFIDCNTYDLCMSFEDLSRKIDQYQPAAVWVVHIGGHIAFEIEKITALCRAKGIILLEDCAHAHGATWRGKKAGSWGDAAVYSFYATKTMPTGEGGMLSSPNRTLIEFARQYRNYGKFDYEVQGLNFRMNEFTAAIGCVQTDRLDDIIAWKNEYAHKYLDSNYTNRVKLPEEMISGYYKYIVFDPIERSTGKIYEDPCHHIMKKTYELENTNWIAKNHWCVPIYYKGTESL